MIALVLVLVLFASPALAADLTCSIPAAAVPRAQELCELLRVKLRVRTTDWSNDVCATELLRLGLLQAEKVATKAEAKSVTGTMLSDAVAAMHAAHPIQATVAYCGDGQVDSIGGYVEECDDGVNNGNPCHPGCVLP